MKPSMSPRTGQGAFSFAGLLISLLLLGILAGGMYSMGGRGAGGIPAMRTAPDAAEVTKTLADLEALRAGASVLALERRGSPLSGLHGDLDALQAHVDRRLNPERHAIQVLEDHLYVGIRISGEVAERLPLDRKLYFNTSGETPSEGDSVSQKVRRTPGWAFLRVR